MQLEDNEGYELAQKDFSEFSYSDQYKSVSQNVSFWARGTLFMDQNGPKKCKMNVFSNL